MFFASALFCLVFVVFMEVCSTMTSVSPPQSLVEKRGSYLGVPYFEVDHLDDVGVGDGKPGLRGISAVSQDIAWASGQFGTIVRTTDGGRTWQKVSSPDNLVTVDYRDIEAFDENTAIVMGVGTPARFYKTSDGGASWLLTYTSDVPGTFYDAMDFWGSSGRGIAFGDPIGGRLTIVRTNDFGDTWEEAPEEERPVVEEGVIAFAASGTCLRTEGAQRVFIVLGNKTSTVLSSDDGGKTWLTSDTAVESAEGTKGLFSIDLAPASEIGVTVGGDYNGDEATGENNAAVTIDGGITWSLMDKNKNPDGYRSVVTYVNQDLILTCGKESCDYTYDLLGEGFLPMQTTSPGGFYTISASKDGKAAFAAGKDGKLGRLAFKASEN